MNSVVTLDVDPIQEDDAFIRQALEETSVPALMLSMMHMSGDYSLMDGEIKPGMAMMGEIQGYLTPEQQAQVREQALAIIRQYRDGGCELPPPPDRDTLHRMMQFIVGDEVPEEYLDLIIEESNLYGDDRRAFQWQQTPPESRLDDFKVLVIGAGQSGVLAGIRLNEAGIAYEIAEKNDGIGGTWWENDYPGARVDVANHFYSYSFEPNHDWPEHYSRQPQLAAYFKRCSDKYQVTPNIRFRTEVESARYDEASERWTVRFRHADGSQSEGQYNAVISAVGQLNRPKIPTIEGRERFGGPQFHSSDWDHSVDLSGKRVAVVGTGASAFQIVPSIADSAAEVQVYQRSPNWMFPNERYHAKVGEGKIWCLKHLPFYARWYRFLHFWMMADKTHPMLFVDPEWPHQDRSISEMNDMTRMMFADYMEQQCGDDEELKQKIMPDYPPLGKRMLQDNGSWIQTLRRDNVDLIAQAVKSVDEQGITDDTGEHRQADVIIWATGFQATRFLWPMEITGKDGQRLSEVWGDDPQTHLGITTPGFPNLFCVYGPGNNLGHGGSLIFYSECQLRYIMDALRYLLEQDKRSLDCKPEVAEDYHRRFSEAAARTVWAHKGMKNWYKNAAGKVVTTSPWRLIDFWRWTREFDAESYRVQS